MSPRSASLQCHTAFCMRSSRIGTDQSGWCFGAKSFSHLLILWELLVKHTSMMSWFSLSLRRTKVSSNSTWEGWTNMNGTTTWRPASMKISTLLLGNTTWQKTIRGDPANRTQLWKGSKLKGKIWIFPFLLRHQLIIADTNQDLLSLQELPPPEPDVPPAAAPAYPPDVRDRPARAEAAPVSSRPTFQLRTNGYWYWSRNLEDWVWYQTGNRNEQNPYSPDFIPSDDTLNDWMGRGWIDWTCRFGYRSY